MSYRVRKYNANNKTSEQKIVEGFLKALWWLISAPFKFIFLRRKAKIQQAPAYTNYDASFTKSKWQEIETLMSLGKPSNFTRAVMEADKLLDHILKAHRAPGLTMGDRLKSSRRRFTPEAYEGAWKAHKVRNELVHNSQYELMDYQAKQTIENYKRAINELIHY